MEESFGVRVDKAFGSLASAHGTTSSSSASLSSLWCLADDEIERNEWNREKDGPEPEEKPRPGPFRSNGFLDNITDEKYSGQMEKDLDDLDDGGDDDDEEEDETWLRASSSQSEKPDDFNDDEWEIKSSIGLDCTLDFEEEKDEFDKVAVGEEKSGDRLYMKDVNDYETDADDWNSLPGSFRDVTRDPRANHIAAKLRLKEDAEAASKMNSLRVSERIVSLRVSENDTKAEVYAKVDSREDGNLKSILKRKDSRVDTKLQKRVRFSSECKHDSDEVIGGDMDSIMKTCSSEEGNFSKDEYRRPPDDPSGIPDYMRNPSKYICYTFDSDEMDEESNKQAYMDFLKMLKSRRDEESLSDDAPIELPKSVTFVPRRKPGDATMMENETELTQNQYNAVKELVQRKGVPVGIAAADSKHDEVCPMEEDELETDNGVRIGPQRWGRQYRSKTKEDPDE